EAGDLVSEERSCPGGNQNVQNPEQEARANQPQLRRQNQRKQQRDSKGAQIVESQNLGHEIFKLNLVLENPKKERDFQPDKNSHDDHLRIQNQSEALQVGEH